MIQETRCARPCLLDLLVGAQLNRWGHGKTKRLGGPEVHDHLKFCRELHPVARKIGMTRPQVQRSSAESRAYSDSTGPNRRHLPKRRNHETNCIFVVAVVNATGVIAWMAPSSLAQDNRGQVTKTQTGTKDAKQIIVTTIPRGYRDWKFISAAHEAGELNDIRVAIGNDKAIKAYRAGKPFPEGTIIGRVAWKMVPSEENNKTFGQAQSFVPGDAPDWYLQFMEKNTKKYAATGGWGYSNFGKDLKPLTDEKIMYSCYTCHKAVEARDYIFTKYAP